MSAPRPQLPVEKILPELSEVLGSSSCALLQAPPGSGKTTRVPLALLDAGWLQGKGILVLEPRRLAASSAARYMASLLGEEVGQRVGYSVRYEQRRSAATRVEVVTEGLLTRRLQNDPDLAEIGLVIFDEFHERNLHGDLALALCRDVQLGLRDDLRLLVMSATLDVSAVAGLLDDCPVVRAEGRSYPVDVEYLGTIGRDVAESMALGVRKALSETRGDVLAFLPGAAEIHRCLNRLRNLEASVRLCPLYGAMPFAEQQKVMLPGKDRRVVLATNVAETSLTIEGISTVVDSGWEKRPRYDAARGMDRLEQLRISRASAEQRAGRAGRLEPGRCYRLWSEGEQGALLPFAPAEIRQADLAPLLFELALWGVSDPRKLAWLDPPPAGHLAAARELLAQLGALTPDGALTSRGRSMSRYPTHPRLSRMLVSADERGVPGLGSDLVALLDERDILAVKGNTSRSGPSDLLERLELLRGDGGRRYAAVHRAANFWRKRTGARRDETLCPDDIGPLLASAFPDRVGRRRREQTQTYLLRSGQGAHLSSRSVVNQAEWLVAVELAGRSAGDAEIRLASVLDQEDVEAEFGRDLLWQREALWDDSSERVRARQVRRLGAIILQEKPEPVTSADSVPALCDLIRRKGLQLLPWTDETVQLRARVHLLHGAVGGANWPDWSDSSLMSGLEEWLSPWLQGLQRRQDLNKVDLKKALMSVLGWEHQKELDRLAPPRLDVPSGSHYRLDYRDEDGPVLAAKLQEMFGLAETPRVVDGRVPVRLHLLSPAGRPLAITSDLRNFWDQVYPEVCKEMRGRYPKHPWPDDPWTAPATRRTKPR